MKTTDIPCPGLTELIERLDRSVEAGSPKAITAAVKADLEEMLGSRKLTLPGAFMAPCADAYARRLLHRDPDGSYVQKVPLAGFT